MVLWPLIYSAGWLAEEIGYVRRYLHSLRHWSVHPHRGVRGFERPTYKDFVPHYDHAYEVGRQWGALTLAEARSREA